jgi:hypothetical protein
MAATFFGDEFAGDSPMDGSEDRRDHATDLRAREGAIFVYKELPKWFFVAQLETLEVDDWGIKATVLPLPSVGLSCPPQAFVVSGAWDALYLTEMCWRAPNVEWSMFFGEEIVAQLTSHAAGLAHLPLPERIPALVRSLSAAMRKCQ